ncbi:MAG: lipid-A-disaccharide synthase [Acidobacteria bacterium]|nr:lipid-A-disaccharide synthase [Acidobacteriota bacterium]
MKSAAAPTRIFVSAGEASGDLYGSFLIQTLRQQHGEMEFFGCGGQKMRAAGCRTVVDAAEITMVGLLEVLPGLPRAWRALRHLQETVRSEPPDLAVLIDFPDFNLRLARTFRQLKIPVVYFVAPQVWAWRTGRLKILRQNVNRLLCIFPFEEAFFRKAGVQAEFIGHPLIGRVKPQLKREEFAARFDLPTEQLWIGLLPGSRRREILLNLPAMLEAAREISRSRKCLFLVPAAVTGGWLSELASKAELPVRVLENHAYEVMAYSDAAIVASGTATIEAALLGTPMAVVYRVSGISGWLGRRLVRTPFYSMVNLVAGREIVPEFIQERFEPSAVARAIAELLDSPAARTQMAQGLQEVCEKLEGPEQRANAKKANAIQRAAAIVESMLEEAAAGQTARFESRSKAGR